MPQHTLTIKATHAALESAQIKTGKQKTQRQYDIFRIFL